MLFGLILISFALFRSFFWTTILLVSCIFFSIVFLFIFLYLNKRVKQTNWYKAFLSPKGAYPDNHWYRENLIRNYDIAVIGSSGAKYAFDFEDSGVKGWNWAEQPQSMVYGYKILKNYFSILRKDGVVIITILPFSGLNVKYPISAYDKYYLTLDAALIDNYNPLKRELKYPLLYAPLQSLKRLLKDVTVSENVDSDVKEMNDEDLKKDAEAWIDSWKKQFGIRDLGEQLTDANRIGQEVRVQLLSEIIEFCLERELKPVIVLPPVHDSLSTKFSDTFRENYIYQFIQKANVQNIPFYNYLDDEKFRDRSYYANSFFLNGRGRKLFTEQILRDLNLIVV